jgi:hypothetical protein
MRHFFLAAILCGALPLILGMTIYSLWRATGADWLMLAGLLNIGLGCLLLGAGSLCLALYARRARAAAIPAWRIRVFAAGALLLLNFPAAAMLVVQAETVRTTFTVTVVNRSSLAHEALTVTGPADHFELGTVRVELPP